MGQNIVWRFDAPKNSITNLTTDTKAGKNVGAGPANMTVQILATKVTEGDHVHRKTYHPRNWVFVSSYQSFLQ